jgi:hypothetical protein
MIHYNLNAKEDLEFASFAKIDIAKFVGDGNCYKSFELMNEAKKVILNSFESDDNLYDLTDGTKYEGSRYESDLAEEIVKNK